MDEKVQVNVISTLKDHIPDNPEERDKRYGSQQPGQ
jgi:hypothetical protein